MAGGLSGIAGSLYRHRFEYVLLLPALAVAALVVLYPIVYAVDLSLHETSFLEKGEFVGLRHYAAFFGSTAGWQVLKNSLVLVIGSTALAIPIGLGLALLLHTKIRLKAAFRMVLVLPWVISQVITALLWKWILNVQFGLARLVTDALGVLPIDFVGEFETAMPTLILVNVWRTVPFAMLLLLAALQTVPRELHEAAEIDGAGTWSRFRHVTLPLIKSTVLVVAIMLSLSYFNHVDLPLILTGGGPLGETRILALAAYEEAFVLNKMGYGSAIAVVVFAVNILLSLVYMRLLRTERHV